ncbi:hypothetical protein QYE76_041836 [Lolium multiflorum]|uniref:Myb-like domain-containing protein n=1 Tax=Lolium multiflorum TaxID=4521 RepID=A0AAD8WWR4_LOLMU|nr:hypothetical protein QYE76_041836 [Lolium multiflorum]
MKTRKYIAPRMSAPDALAAKPALVKKWMVRTSSTKERPEGMTNAECAFDIQRRSVENSSRRAREARLKEKRAAAAAAKQVTLMERAAAMAAPLRLCIRNPPHLFRFSASCHDFNPLCGFNPNTFAAPNTFTTGDLHMLAGSLELQRSLYSGGVPPPHPDYQQFTASSSAQAPFGAMPGDAIVEDMIIDSTNGQPSFTQQEAEAYVEDEKEGDDVGWENEVYTFTEAHKEIAPAIVDPKGKKKKAVITSCVTTVGADQKTKAGRRGPKWSSREDECLTKAWKTVSIDPFTGSNQNAESYWKRVKAAFDERWLLDPYFKALTTDRNVSPLAHDAAHLQQVARHCGGDARHDHRLPRGQRHIEFKFVHVFARIETCDKWTEVRTALARANVPFDPNATATPVVVGRPVGNKKAKTMRDAAMAIEMLHSSISACIADAATHAATRAEQAAKMEEVASVMERQDDVYVCFYSCRQCWASKSRGL